MSYQDPRESDAKRTLSTGRIKPPLKAVVDPQYGSSRRGSLSIIQPKVSLNDMLRMAKKIKFDNGSNAADMPLPVIDMKFKVLPISALSAYTTDKTCGLNRGDKLTANEPMECVDVKAELDLGVILQRWLTKLIDSEIPESAAPRRGSSFGIRKSDDSGKSLSKMSAKQASAESLYKFARDRGNSDLPRPWTNSITPTTSMIDASVCPSSSGTLSKLVRQSSNGSVDLCIQSVDLLSSNSSVSESLSEKCTADRR